MMLSPLSFGPVQFRVGGLLLPLALINPIYGVGLALGTAISNLFSPFGWYDFVVMPLVVLVVTTIAYRLRSYPLLTLIAMAAAMAVAIAYFPLYLGGGIPFWATVGPVFLSLVTLYLCGWYLIWRNVKEWLQ